MGWFSTRKNNSKTQCKQYLRKNLNKYKQQCKDYKPDRIDKLVLGEYYQRFKRSFTRNKIPTKLEKALSEAKNFAERKEKGEKILAEVREVFQDAEHALYFMGDIGKDLKQINFSSTTNTPQNVLKYIDSEKVEGKLKSAEQQVEKVEKLVSEAKRLVKNAPESNIAKNSQNFEKRIKELKDDLQHIKNMIKEAKAKSQEEERRRAEEEKKKLKNIEKSFERFEEEREEVTNENLEREEQEDLEKQAEELTRRERVERMERQQAEKILDRLMKGDNKVSNDDLNLLMKFPNLNPWNRWKQARKTMQTRGTKKGGSRKRRFTQRRQRKSTRKH